MAYNTNANYSVGSTSPGSTSRGRDISPGSRSPGSTSMGSPGSTSPGNTSRGDTSLGSLAYPQSSGFLYYSGKEVRINRAGPDSITGRLLKVQGDHIVVETKEPREVVYMSTSHIKSITSTHGESSGSYSYMPRYINAPNFRSMIEKLTHRFVQMNNGPEKVEGFIVSVANGFVFLVNNREVLKISMYHIKSIRVLSTNKSSGDKSGGNDKSDKNSNKSNSSKSSGSKSSSKNKSSGKSSHKSSSKSSKSKK